MKSVPVNSRQSDATRRNFEVTSQELHHLRSALETSPKPLVALHALLMVGLDAQLSQDRLAESLGLTPVDVDQLLDVLVRSGNLRRARSGRAGPAEFLRLTPQGKCVLDTFHGSGCEHVSSALALFDLDHKLALSLGFDGVKLAFRATG